MKPMKFRKTLSAAILTGSTMVGASALADTPQGTYSMGSGMMDGYGFSGMGGYGGAWVPILLVIVVVGLVAWIVTQRKK